MTDLRPAVGSDRDTWGTKLLSWLGVSVDTDGTLKAAAVRTALGGSRPLTYSLRSDGTTITVWDKTRAQVGTGTDLAALVTSLGAGTYALGPDTFPLLTTLTLPSNTSILGCGMGVTVIAPVFGASPPNRCIDNDWVNGNSNILLRDFTLSRAGANAQHGILLNGVTGLTIDSVEVAGLDSVTSGAIGISGVGPTTRLLSTDVRVENCRFGSTDNFGVQLSFVLNAVVVGNTFDDCYREAVGVEPEPSCTARNISITGNTFTTGTIPSGGSATGVIVVTTSSGGTIDGVAITGNTLRNTLATLTNANPGITLLGGTNVVVGDNVIIGMNGPGISCGSASIATIGAMIVGNSINTCGEGQTGTFNQAAISLRQATQCLVVGNYVKGTHHTASVFESSSASRNIIAYNQLLDSTTVTLLAGSHTVIRQNGVNRSGSGVRVATATNYTLVGNEEIVAVTDTSSARTITLPAANVVSEGCQFTVKDESGAAGTNNITISRAGTDTIDGATSIVVSANFGKARIYSDGVSKWFTT